MKRPSNPISIVIACVFFVLLVIASPAGVRAATPTIDTSKLDYLPASTVPSPPTDNETVNCAAVSDIPQSECEALVALFQSTGGPSWVNKEGWLDANTSPCSWYGVNCKDGHVAWLDLPDNQLQGPLPSTIDQLTKLRSLDLHRNQLTGAIPDQLGNLQELVSIIFWSNQLSGPIPTSLGNLSNLYSLVLSGNQLTGGIPPELGNLSNLAILHLGSNQLSGEIPGALASLTKMTDFRVDDNQLSEPMPAWIGTFSALEKLYLDDNPFTAGPIPAEYANLTGLTHLYLRGSQRTGPIPEWIGNLDRLVEFHADENSLSGPIPTGLGNLAELEELSLHNNQLSGQIPEQLGNLLNLEELWLHENKLSGPIPATFGNLASLEATNLGGNGLTGSIPASIGNLSNLEQLWINSTFISGPLPASLGQLNNLQVLGIAWTQIEGEIPAALGNLAALETLYLWDNNLSGTIPAELGNLSKLEILYIGANDVSGTLPASLGNLANLQELYISETDVTGPIPAALGNLAQLRELGLYSNQLTGAIPAALGNLTALRELYLYRNQLSGTIPASLGLLQNVEYLYLSGNQLEGALPVTFQNLANVKQLTVARNRLSGAVPAEIAALSALEELYLYDNEFGGELPNALTSLTSLSTLHFFGTDVCEPAGGPVRTWLDNLAFLEGTGNVCGALAGSLSGAVTNDDGQPLAGIQVSLLRRVQGPGQAWTVHVAGAGTDAAGQYRFDWLADVDYLLKFSDPAGIYGVEYHRDAGSPDDADPISVEPGATATINATLDDPVPPAVNVTTEASVTTDAKSGQVTVSVVRNSIADITITRAATCSDGSTPSAVALVATGATTDTTFPMDATSRPGAYAVTISAAALRENVTLAVRVTCNGTPTTTEVGGIQLYDPSGVITNAVTGQPITNATVTLYTVPGWLPKLNAGDVRVDTCESNNSKATGTAWSQPAPVASGVLADPALGTISPTVSRMQTNAEGRYGWDVAQGCWYVVVTAPGYATLVSPVVGVPPAVTDLDLQLEPVAVVRENPVFLPMIPR